MQIGGVQPFGVPPTLLGVESSAHLEYSLGWVPRDPPPTTTCTGVLFNDTALADATLLSLNRREREPAAVIQNSAFTVERSAVAGGHRFKIGSGSHAQQYQ
jgi:hypothetical protein